MGDLIVKNSTDFNNFSIVNSSLALSFDGADVIIGTPEPYIYYVSSSGNDANDGTQSNPYLTLTKAIE